MQDTLVSKGDVACVLGIRRKRYTMSRLHLDTPITKMCQWIPLPSLAHWSVCPGAHGWSPESCLCLVRLPCLLASWETGVACCLHCCFYLVSWTRRNCQDIR